MYNYIQFHGTKYKITLVPCVYYDSLTLKVALFMSLFLLLYQKRMKMYATELVVL
nr:MAG TPA: hypothetical protein [Caudoviricetes sp.]